MNRERTTSENAAEMRRPQSGSRNTLEFSMRPRRSGGAQPHVSVPSTFAPQRHDFIAFAPGMLLSVCEYHFREPARLQFQLEDNHCVAFGFMISGTTSISTGGRSKNVSNFAAPGCLLSNIHGTGTQHYPAGETLRNVEICAEPEALQSMLGDAMALMPRPLRSTRLSRKMTMDFGSKLTPSMQYVCHEILSCPSGGGHLRRLFMESKALELITLLLQSLETQTAGPAATRSSYVSPEDRDKLHAVRDMLLSEYDDPPTIMALARRVGMNDCKLKQLFKEHFGTTMYAMVRGERMLKAKRYLQEGLTVSQAASKVGYVSFGRFSECFKRYYGMTPSAYKRSL